VTISTVGYGDRFPVTNAGRFLGAFIIVIGVGIFGTFTGYLANFFLSPSKKSAAAETPPEDVDVRSKVADLPTDPETKLPKRYVATVSGKVSDAKLERLRNGIELEDFRSVPAKAERRSEHDVALTLTEGKFHQVKRMLGAVGLATLELHREAVGEYVIDVPIDTLREMTDEEVERLLGYRPRHLDR
jgi:hypothetical protein